MLGAGWMNFDSIASAGFIGEQAVQINWYRIGNLDSRVIPRQT